MADPLHSLIERLRSAGEAEPYLDVFIRQPIPQGHFIPAQMEALVDVRNLMAQGYVPVVGQDGQTIYLVQSARSIRGGVAFSRDFPKHELPCPRGPTLLS